MTGAIKLLPTYDQFVAIYPGDPRDRFRTRRGWLFGLGGVLFLPAQGLFLVRALDQQQPVLWLTWFAVLVTLVITAVLWMRDDRRRGRELPPWTPGPLLVAEGLAAACGLVLSAVAR